MELYLKLVFIIILDEKVIVYINCSNKDSYVAVCYLVSSY